MVGQDVLPVLLVIVALVDKWPRQVLDHLSIMRIGVISDTHIPRQAKEIPREVFEHFKGVEMILHAGDLTNLNVVDELRQITPNVEAVIGNMDPAENQDVLPVKKIINVSGIKIGLIHGWGPPWGIKNRLWDEFKDDAPNVIIFGHTHQPEKITMHDTLFLNPGSPTDKMFASVNSIAILTIEDKRVDGEIIQL